MKVVMIDNYDSFTYNLVHLVKELGADITVYRNDKFELEDLEQFDKIMLSPGPGIPSEAGKLLDVIREYAGIKPILGICLGEQAIGESFGGKLVNLSDVFHGVQTPAHVALFEDRNGGKDVPDYIFRGLHQDILVGRYHSWVVDAASLPDCLEVTCFSNEGQVMALRHKEYDIRGIQFHPESVLTPDGKKMINNWLLHV
ncbi:MAG: aminodeoxychorismate/anthranilate synthase component II [Bacteroidales bacterium]|nr:aminodeoxychorismate/anthranilate synthase component II [Candidatus Liminaster caballi]